MSGSVNMFYGDQLDPPELVERCLNCKYDENACFGEYRCAAERRDEVIKKESVIEYAMKKGISAKEIEQSTDGYITRRFIDTYKAKNRQKRREENK